MNLISLVMAVAGSALCAASFWLLVVNTSGACSGVLSLVACAGIIVCSVAAADGWYKLLGGKFKKNK